ncbi:MAG: hypothetical protein HOH95_03300, partial [Dehalococcoidia bacterium]|nr:hypothetical protein [Dehalococcoidia bacterium]
VDPTPLPPPGPDTFGRTGPLATPRSLHTATLLDDGTVLITGGNHIYEGLLTSAEIYDPTASVPTTSDDPDHPAILLGAFHPTGSLTHARQTHAATRLADGRVLITGGVAHGGAAGTLSSAEIYDPATETFEDAGDMTVPRLAHATTLLPDGRVLIIGGFGNPYIAESEIYDPATGAFTPTGSMHFGRAFVSIVHLTDGRILVHGAAFEELQPPEIYDPTTGTFALLDGPPDFQWPTTATGLEDGRILLTGDCCDEDFVALPTAAILDVTTADLQTISPMNEGRFGHEAVALLDGRILLTGGGAVGGHGWSPSQSAEIYDPATATFTLIDQMSDGRHWHTTTLLPDGTVLVVGDRGDPTTYSAELFAPR